MSAPKPITLTEYQEVGPEFFEKFHYVKNQLPHGTEVEEVLTIMETLASLVLIKRDEDEEEGGDSSKIGFLK
jgi:hypothetical protein